MRGDPRSRYVSLALAAAISAAAPVSAQEDDTEAVRRGLRLPTPPTVEISARGPRAAPAVSMGVPTAFGADWGDAFVGVGFQSSTRFRDREDGGAVAGFGIGDARKLVGLEVAVSSFGTLRTCCRGGVSLKLHRLLPGAAAVAVGWENVAGWGAIEGQEGTGTFTDGGSSVWGAVSKVFSLGAPYRTLTATVGAGGGRFRAEEDVIEEESTVNAFGSVGVRVIEPASVVATWTGQDLNAGVSVVPVRRVPLVVSAGVADLTTRGRFILGVGFGFGYSQIF